MKKFMIGFIEVPFDMDKKAIEYLLKKAVEGRKKDGLGMTEGLLKREDE